MIRYTKDHEWLRRENGVITVGITDFAQNQLGDLVFVELPAVGKVLTPGAVAAVVESVKAASEVYAPLSCTIVEVNQAVVDKPELVNTDAESSGWLFKVSETKPEEFDALLDAAAYLEHIA